MIETRTDRSHLARTWWAVLLLVGVASVATDFVLTLTDPADDGAGVGTRVVRFFSFFTIESNLLVLATVLPLARDAGHDGAGWRVWRLASLLGITVTGLVYVVVLAPDDDPQGLHVWTNAGLHYFAPIVTVVGWLLLGPRPRITGSVVVLALLWPVAWIGYTLVHGAVTHWYPYDFLDVSDLGYAVALRNLALVVLLALLFLLAFWLVDRRLPAGLTGPGGSATRR